MDLAFFKLRHFLLGNRIALMVVLIWRLRPINILRSFHHRYRLRSGSYINALPAAKGRAEISFWQGGKWRFDQEAVAELRISSLARGDEIVTGVFRQFESVKVREGANPQWHKGSYEAQRLRHFSEVLINAIPGDDVKCCWDLSRFKWLAQLVVAAIHADDATTAKAYLDRAQGLLSDWLVNNGFFLGVNWACGQEVSVRGLYLMHSLLLLDRHFGAKPTAASLDFLSMSCRRVEATLSYSLAQENNHSVTETLFLFYAPLFVSFYGSSVSLARSSSARRKLAQATLLRLIQRDGSFRMYSINYHRAMCDILSLYKLLDDALDGGFWEQKLLHRIVGMHNFLEAVITKNGGAPLIGHNDGSLHVIQYSSYEDYAPSLALLSCAFDIPLSRRFATAVAKTFLFGRRPTLVDPPPVKRLRCFDDFGLVIVRCEEYEAFLKYARNAGRPGQEDFLHLDLWVRGENTLHDSGSYSYNPFDVDLINLFDSAKAHNGLYLKNRPLVHRLGRFLYLEWPKVDVNYVICASHVNVDMNLVVATRTVFQRTFKLKPSRIEIFDRGPSDEDWALSFNISGALSVNEGEDRVVLSNGSVISSDGSLCIEPAFFSKTYLDIQQGTRILVDGGPGGRRTVVQILEV